MAAIYSGIHLKLKSPQTAWEDKLKLARFAWISPQCLLPNKEQVLLDWCTHALTLRHNKKVNFSQQVLEGLWCYFDDVLHSRKLQTLLKQGKTITLRLNMAQLLLDHLQECGQDGSKSLVGVSTLLSVCQGILSSPSLSSVFTTKYELMVDLLAKFCCLACRELQQPSLIGRQMTETVTRSDEPMTECIQTEPAAKMENPQTETISDSSPDQADLDFKKSSEAKANLRSANLFEVVLQVLSCYLSVQRQQANPNRVFTMLTNQLLQPLVLLRHLLTCGDFTPSHAHLGLHQQLCKELRIKCDSVIQLALFPPELLNFYKEELFPVKEDSGKRGSGGPKGPLKPVAAALCKLSARDYCKPSIYYAVKSSTLSLLYKFFLEKYGKVRGEAEEEQKMLCFYFLTRLIPVLDLHLEKCSVSIPEAAPESGSPQQDSPLGSLCSPERWNLALLAVEALLSQTLSADIYNVAADRIRHGEVQLSFYRTLTQTLFNEAKPSIPSWYRCLKVLVNLNHLILEPDLDQLLSSAWVNAECLEARVQRARQLMVCSLLQTYTKLRQLPRLFSELLSVIVQPALDDLRPPLLPQGICTSLRTCLMDIPPSQGLEICSLVLESIGRFILPDLVKKENEGEKMETDKGLTDLEKKDASLKLCSLSQLLHVVLFGLKTLDNASPVPLVRQSQDLMDKMQQFIKELLNLLSVKKPENSDTSSSKGTQRKDQKKLDSLDSENTSDSEIVPQWERKTQEAALLLRYTWVEVDTLFDIHCSKYKSRDSGEALTEADEQACSSVHIETLLSCEMFPARLHPSPHCSPLSCFLIKLLVSQQVKKIMLDSDSLCNSGALLNRAAEFILAKPEFNESLDEDEVWDGQVGSVNARNYLVAHWYLVMSNLPLIIPHLSAEGISFLADGLLSSLLKRKDRHKDELPGSLTLSLISSEVLHSPTLTELPTLFSAMVQSLTQRIVSVLKTAQVTKVSPTVLMFQETETEISESNANQSLSVPLKKETLVENLLASSQTRELCLLLSGMQTKELLNILEILTQLNADGINSEDLSLIFLVLFFILTSTSSQLNHLTQDASESADGALFIKKLLQSLIYLLESRNFQSILKLTHAASLLQAAVTSLFWSDHLERFQTTQNADWLDLVKAVQDFIKSLVQLIIRRNSSVRLNLDQFTSYLTSKEMACKLSAASSSEASIFSVHFLLACLSSFSKALTSNLEKSKKMDETLIQILTRLTASLGPAVKSILKPQTVIQPAAVLDQAFIVEVVTVMLQSELSSLSVEEETKQSGTLIHMSLYQAVCQQILKEISSAHRPMDFLVTSLQFLSVFYKAVEKTGEIGKQENEKEELMDELCIQILQNVHRLFTADWLSSTDVGELEPAVQELLCHLMEKCTTSQFSVLMMMIKERLDISKLRAGNCREVLSAVIIIKLLSCCRLPETCSKALWLIAPQITSAMVALVRNSSQHVSLTLPFTVPTVTSLTTLLRQGEGLITNPHHVTLVLGALHSVPLDHLTPPAYRSAFLAVHEALFTFFQCHPQVMVNVTPSFLNVFYRLVASVMQEGRQKGDGDIGPDSDVYLECSRLVERMYSHIAAATESFTMLSSFMVAQYVTELQKVTLRPDVKLHLTEGIYCIMDLCKEQDIKFLTAGLQMGVREVFNELYSSYTHYHKAQRQGEDKYTV